MRRPIRPIVALVAAVAAGILALSALGSGAAGRPPADTLGGASPPSALGSRSGSSDGSVAAWSPAASQVAGAIAMPIVPVTSFRAPWDATDAADVGAVLAGTSERYAAIEVVAADADPILGALGVAWPAATTPRVVLAADAAHLRADMVAHRDRLGFLQLPDIDPSVRALGWAGVSLFGVHRAATLDGWSLRIGLPATDENTARLASYDPATAWTLVAAGDINLDRRVAYAVKQQRRGVDWPFDGGTATITGHTCCNPLGNAIVLGKRTGNAGAVRSLISDASLALANFENSAPDDFDYHPTGFTFSADPALIQGVKDAGFDWLSLANNHIRNYGGQGILETVANLDRFGIAHAGAGANLDAARAPSLLHVGAITVAILGYDTIRPDFAASATRAGTNEMSPERVRQDVAAARAAGADLVIAFPHWGVEYTARTTATQRALAHAAVDAGADLVIGSHPHWAGGLEVDRGVPIFYCLGDFVFDIDASEQTLEGIVPEITFQGTRIVQVRMDPYLILDVSQPNLLDPAGSGGVVLDQVFDASHWLPW
jgi:Bacterial capsule synthesis protein PGA_cap